MPRTAINVVKLKGATGDAQTAENPSTGVGSPDWMYWILQEGDILEVKNIGAGSRDVAIVQVDDRLGRAITPNTLSIPAGEFRYVGPLSSHGWAQQGANSGRVHVDPSTNPTDLRLTVLRA